MKKPQHATPLRWVQPGNASPFRPTRKRVFTVSFLFLRFRERRQLNHQRTRTSD